MKKAKLEKGITLIALIITIIILLILAAVTIGSIKDSSIIGHAQDAASEYTIAQEKERIALAYSEYQIQKTLNSEIEPDTFSIDEATIEPISNLGWKVTYADTGNVYGINSKGEYDEAITMIIEASEETGVSVDKFIIFEDKQAIKENAKNVNVSGYEKLPERYVFYNWAEVTDKERKDLEKYEPTTPSTELVENKTNRMLIMDANGDGQVLYANYGSAGYENSDNYVIAMFEGYTHIGEMTNEIHNFYASITYRNSGENVYEGIVSLYGDRAFEDCSYCFLWDFYNNEALGDYSSWIYEIAEGLIEEDIAEEGTFYSFRDDLIGKHTYYTSPRYEADFE